MVLTTLPYPKFRRFVSSVSVLGYISFDYAAIASYAVITWVRDQYTCTEFALATLLLSDLSTAFYVLVTYASTTYEVEIGSTRTPQDATVSRAATDEVKAMSP